MVWVNRYNVYRRRIESRIFLIRYIRWVSLWYSSYTSLRVYVHIPYTYIITILYIHRYYTSIYSVVSWAEKWDGFLALIRFRHDRQVYTKYINDNVVYTLKTRSHESVLPNLIFLHTYVKKESPKIFVVDAGIIVITPPNSVSPSSV